MVTTGMSPRLPTIHDTLPSADRFTPLARTPSCSGALGNSASHATECSSIWQRVLPDFVSMKTSPDSCGRSTSAAGGDTGEDGEDGEDGGLFVGAAAVGLLVLGREVGKLGSVGDPELVTG